MRIVRWLLILVLVLFILYSAAWWAASFVVGQRVGTVFERLEQRGIEVSVKDRGAKGWLGFGFDYQLTDARFNLSQYGAWVEIPGETKGGVKFLDPFTAKANVPAGMKVNSPVAIAEMGEMDFQSHLTTDLEVDELSINVASMQVNALGMVNVAMQDMTTYFASGGDTGAAIESGTLDISAKMQAIQLNAFMKPLVMNQLPTGFVLPEEDIEISMQARLLPTGPVLDDELTSIKPWLRKGGHVVFDALQIPVYEGLAEPKRALLFMSQAQSLNAVVCPESCSGAACQPDLVIFNLQPAGPEALGLMSLPGEFSGLDGEALCKAL